MATGTGRFITIEGGEGSGKSTQCALLADALRARKIPLLLTREPGGSEGGEQLRKLLLESKSWKWDQLTETLLFIAARRDHVVQRIRPALESGKWVLCDRFQDSTIAYQGYGRGLGANIVQSLYTSSLGAFVPDFTVLLDIPVEKGLERARKATGDLFKDRFENEALAFHTRVREGFHTLAKSYPERIMLINAEGGLQDVHGRIMKAVSDRFGL